MRIYEYVYPRQKYNYFCYDMILADTRALKNIEILQIEDYNYINEGT